MQQTLFEVDHEHPAYLATQLPSYLGNKRALLGNIDDALCQVRERVGGRKLRLADLFAGSGAVSRLMKQHATEIHCNDLEPYAAALARSFLANVNECDEVEIAAAVDTINRVADSSPIRDGFIRTLYSPRIDDDIQPGERAFYTSENAARLDTYRTLIHALPEGPRTLLLGPLLVIASIHANTGGVFKGFYKDRNTGIGKFGGTNSDALTRITGRVILQPPILSRYSADVSVYQGDATAIASQLPEVDLAYLDPPYNQHPYGSNYFMLNLIAENREPTRTSRVSGIPQDWNRSPYNVKSKALDALDGLIASLPARFVLLSYSDDGFIAPEQMRSMLRGHGTATVADIRYPTYRASRNLASRSLHVTEHLYLLERS